MYNRDEEEFPLPDSELKKLQKKDAISNDDSYDIDKIQEQKPKPPNVKEEQIPKTKPQVKEPEEFFTDLEKQFLLPDDGVVEEETFDEPEEYKESEYSTRVSDGMPNSDGNREYLNRHETIFSDPKDLVQYETKKTIVKREVPKKPPPAKETSEDKIYSGVVTVFAIIFFTALVIFFFGIFIYITKDKVELTEYEKQEAIEMSTFLSYNEPFILGMNELSNQKKNFIENYIRGTITREDLFIELLAVSKKEEQIIDFYNEYSWTFEAVRTLDGMTLEFLNSNKDTTLSLVNSAKSGSEKGSIIQIYNQGATRHSSQLDSINQYAKQEVDKLGVDTYIEGSAIQIDLSNVR